MVCIRARAARHRRLEVPGDQHEGAAGGLASACVKVACAKVRVQKRKGGLQVAWGTACQAHFSLNPALFDAEVTCPDRVGRAGCPQGPWALMLLTRACLAHQGLNMRNFNPVLLFAPPHMMHRR